MRHPPSSHRSPRRLLASCLLACVPVGGTLACKPAPTCMEHPVVQEDMLRGRTWMAEGRHAKARLAFSHAHRLCPQDLEAAVLADLAAVAVAAETPERITDANINELDYAVEVLATRFPESQHLLRTARGNIQARAGNHEEAISAYRDALALRPDFVPAMQFQAQVLMAMGRDVDAEALLRVAARTERTHVPSRELLARILVARGNPREAADVLREAVANNPRSTTHVLLAELARSEGRSADAEAGYRAALVLRADEATALFGLAAVLLSEGKNAAAQPLLQRYVQVAPEQGEPAARVTEAQRALRKLEPASPGATPEPVPPGTRGAR